MTQPNGPRTRFLVRALTALSENTYMSAIRAGMVSIVPLTIIGGLFMIVAEFPSESWKAIVQPYRPLLQVPVTATYGLLSVFVCFAIAYDLGKRLKQEAVVSASMATLIFLMLQIEFRSDYAIEVTQADLARMEQVDIDQLEVQTAVGIGSADLSRLESAELIKTDNPALSMRGLGWGGLFTSILIALVAVRVQKLFGDANLVVKLPESVPRIVYESFLSLTPLLFLVIVFWIIRFVIGVDINHAVQTALSPLVFALNTLPGILTYALIVTMLWSVGINGDIAMEGIVAPVFLQYLLANAAAMHGGDPLPYITAKGFFTTFVNVGGTGATIGLALVMWNSKEPGFRQVSRLSLPTQIFQINEPIFFGMPIVMNPVFMIPYVLNALILTASTFLLMSWNVIEKPFVDVPWTTPPVIGHYLVTGGDWRAAVWGVASIFVAMAVYYPFAKLAERARLKQEVERGATT